MQLLNKPFIWLIKAYRFLLSPWVGRNCRFTPSCSKYALEAFQKYPFYKALPMTLKRLSKCHPFHEGGIDPID